MGRKQRETRARAAAPKREAYLAQQEAAAPRPAGPDPWWKTALIAGSLIGLALAGVLVWILWIEPWWDRHQLVNQTGRPRGTAFGDGVIALLDAVDVEKHDNEPTRRRTLYRTRVTVLDASTGAEVARHLFDSGGQGCVSATSALLWCDLGPLAVHDARTFARVATIAEAVAAAGVGRPVPDRWHVEGDRAYWLLDDGRAAVVDAATLAVRVEDKAPAELLPHPITGHAPEPGQLFIAPTCDPRRDPMLQDAGKLTAGKDTWSIQHRNELRSGVIKKGGPAPTATFLQPMLLAAHAGAPLILHHASMDQAKDHGRISRLGPDGAAAWTVDLPAGCETWRLDGDNLLVTSRDARGRVVSVDADDGTVRWRR